MKLWKGMVNDMERLTDKMSFCEQVECRTCGDKTWIGCYERKLYDKLKEYEDLEEQGLLLKLPCKVGDKVYFINCLKEIVEEKVSMITQKADRTMKYRMSGEFGCYDITQEEFMENYYPTKAEAEKALEEMEK